MKIEILLLLLLVTSCHKAHQVDNSVILNILLNDVIINGVSRFRYQADMFGKEDWNITINDHFVPADTLLFLFVFEPGDSSTIRKHFYKEHREFRDSSLDFTRLSVPRTSISSFSLNDSIRNWADYAKPDKNAAFVISKFYQSSLNDQYINVLVSFFCQGNVRVMFYSLEQQAPDVFKIHSRAFL